MFLIVFAYIRPYVLLRSSPSIPSTSGQFFEKLETCQFGKCSGIMSIYATLCHAYFDGYISHTLDKESFFRELNYYWKDYAANLDVHNTGPRDLYTPLVSYHGMSNFRAVQRTHVDAAILQKHSGFQRGEWTMTRGGVFDCQLYVEIKLANAPLQMFRDIPSKSGEVVRVSVFYWVSLFFRCNSNLQHITI